MERAIFAGGCFWCLEHDLEGLPGVVSAESGYTGGDLSNPTYRNHQGHQEAVIVRFNPLKINYQKLLRIYWRNVDPLDGDGQFCDRGDSYRAVIFARLKRFVMARKLTSTAFVLKRLSLVRSFVGTI